MEALQKEQLSSDSEDEDYVPPEVKAPTLSLRKRSGGLELESDDDDDDDDLSDDADVVDAEVAQLYANADGAGPSSAGAGPSSAGAGSAAAGPSSAGPGPSSAGTGASGLDTGAGSSAAAGSSSAAGSSVAAASSAAADPVVKAGSIAVADGEVGRSKAAVESSAAPGEVATKESVKRREDDATGAPSAKDEEPVAKKPRVESVTENKSIDDIWADMNAGVARAKEPKTTPDAGLAAWLEPSAPPKKEFKVTRLSDLEKSVKREEPTTQKKGRTGLEGVLDVVRGKSERVIEKTKEQWKEFKKDETVNDELEKYKKDKDRYTDKVAFLQRSDVREWEYEQRGRRRR